jgi:hypothetical protein
MQPAPFNLGLTHRLLVAASRAHYDGETPIDWADLAAIAGDGASDRAVNRALAHLAEEGLVEGVCTPAGWLAVRPTARGLGRAGRAARRPLVSTPRTSALALPPTETDAAPAEPIVARARAQVGDSLRRAGTLAAEARDRLSHALSPRLATVRTTMVQAWHTFTTLP